jgi:hypothetical protein
MFNQVEFQVGFKSVRLAPGCSPFRKTTTGLGRRSADRIRSSSIWQTSTPRSGVASTSPISQPMRSSAPTAPSRWSRTNPPKRSWLTAFVSSPLPEQQGHRTGGPRHPWVRAGRWARCSATGCGCTSGTVRRVIPSWTRQGILADWVDRIGPLPLLLVLAVLLGGTVLFTRSRRRHSHIPR